jgi:ABC-type transport system substrate-binding protein
MRVQSIAQTICLACSLLVAACTPATPSAGSGQSASAPPQTFTWSDSTELLARVPCCEASVDKNTTWLLNQMFNGLVAYAPGTSKIVPDLAEKWDISADRLTWTFHLRKGVTFSDGSPLTAQDVKYSWDMAQGPDSRSQIRLGSIVRVETPDDSTVVVVTKTPDTTLLYGIVDIGGLVQSQKSTPDNPIGTGPYVLKEWNRGENVVLERRTNYWSTPPALQKLTYLKRPEETTRLVELTKGDVDMTKLSLDDMDALKRSSDLSAQVPQSSMLVGVRLNTRVAPFDRKEVREAMNYAIDKQAIVTNLLHGAGYAPDGLAGHGVYATAVLKDGYYPYDPQKAAALMTQAGLVKVGDRWTMDGQPITFRLYTPEGRYVQDRAVAEYVAQQLQNFGINVMHQVVPWTVWAADEQKKMIALQEDGGMNGYSLLHPVGNWADQLSCVNKDKYETGYCNADVDAQLSSARSASTEDEQIDHYQKAEMIIVDDAPWLLLYGQNPVWGVRNRVSGLMFTPNEIPVTSGVAIK